MFDVLGLLELIGEHDATVWYGDRLYGRRQYYMDRVEYDRKIGSEAQSTASGTGSGYVHRALKWLKVVS